MLYGDAKSSLTNLVQAGMIDQLEVVPGKVKITTEDGIVTLHGDLPPELEAQAMNIASGVAGVKEVINDFYHGGEFSGSVIPGEVEG
jgi:osmotically-inducible protein OsmY